MFKNMWTGSVTIVEVAAICDYLCGDGGEISSTVADQTPTVRSALFTKKQRGCQHFKTLCSRTARTEVMTLLHT
jgi:hypothetical protein